MMALTTLPSQWAKRLRKFDTVAGVYPISLFDPMDADGEHFSYFEPVSEQQLPCIPTDCYSATLL